MVSPVRSTPPAPDYELLFADEFNGDHVNERDWTFRTGPRTGTGINGLNLARNVRVADGHLIIVAKHEGVDGQPAHTGGGLISRHRFGHGYYECRSRPFMAGRGVHTAFWQRGLGGPENNSIFEIDSHEIDSTQKIACNNLYIDGVLKQRVEGIAFAPTDTSTPGRLGANSGLYEAVGDVTLAANGPPPKAQRFQNYAGTLGDIRVHNRALSSNEVPALNSATP